MDSTPILKYPAPKGESLEPPQSSHPILINGYELHPAFIAMVRVTPLVLRARLAPRFRPKSNFRNEFLGIFYLNILDVISESGAT